MRDLASYFDPAPKARPKVVVVTSASCESYVAQLQAALPHVELANLRPSYGLETQQLEKAERQAMVEGVETQLAEYAKAHPTTGPVHVYLLDGKGLSAGDSDSQATLHALASAALTDPSHTVAAFLPEDPSVQVDGLPDGTPSPVAEVVRSFLADSEAPGIESFESLIERLRTL